MRLAIPSLFRSLTKHVGNSCHARNITHKAIMHRWKPCEVGDNIRDIYTPALFVDLDHLETNMKTLTKKMENYEAVHVRPHVKSHKCPPIALMQIAHGAVGVCCQTLCEADAMVYGGIKDVFITNQVIGLPKLHYLSKLAKSGASISVCVDDLDNITDINTAAREAGVHIDCVVEVNVGQNRCGVEPGEAVVKLAEAINHMSNVNFKGIHCYQGWNQHIRQPEERRAAVQLVVEKTLKTLEALSAKHIDCKYITGGGTGTYPYESQSGVFTEVQPGSYVFMDADYNRNHNEEGGDFNDFLQSLFVLSTVQSVSALGDRAVVDAGIKAVSLDSGVPLVAQNSEQVYSSGGDEHGIIRPAGGLKVGDLLKLIPGHCDPTVNLFDWLIGLRGDKVESVWPITGRGPGI